jgi:hypothetical protein
LYHRIYAGGTDEKLLTIEVTVEELIEERSPLTFIRGGKRGC